MSPLPLNTCYIAAPHDGRVCYAIAALLNSTWARALAVGLGDEARGGYRRFNARLTGSLPVPGGDALEKLIELGYEAQKKQTPRSELDTIVAEALQLSARTKSNLRRLAQNQS